MGFTVDTTALATHPVSVLVSCLLQSLVAVALRCVEGVPEPVLVGLLQQALRYRSGNYLVRIAW